MKLFFQKLKGFTVLETLFAVVIFSLALTSLMAVSGQGVIAVSGAREEMIASYLNQEAIEAVRWWRDNEKLTTPPPTATHFWLMFNNNLTSCRSSATTGGPSAICSVDIPDPASTPTFTQCASGSTGSWPGGGNFTTCGTIYEKDGLYRSVIPGGSVPTGFTQTSFKRGVTVYLSGAPSYSVRVVSRVTWTSKGIDRSSELQVTLMHW